MITFEIILFILAILVGILLYWRESKNNYLYRLVNKITHSKEQQIKSTDRKGFLFMQPFVLRLVFVVILILAVYLITEFLTPVRILDIKYLSTMIVGTLAGTYLATLIVKANKTIENSQEIIDESIKKGKELIEELTTDDKTDTETLESKKQIEKDTKKSARERLKNKGLLK